MRWSHGFSGAIACGALALVGMDAAHAQQADPAAAPTGDAAAQPPAAASSGPATHIVRDGDTLWTLSKQYFDNAYAWPRLWAMNPEVTNPHWIYPGLVIRLRGGAASSSVGGLPIGDDPEVAPVTADFGNGIQGTTRALKRFSGWQTGNLLLREQAYLDRDALRQSGFVVGSSEDHLMMSPADEVFLTFEQPPEELEGKELTIYRHIKDVENQPMAAPVPENTYAPGPADGEVVRVMGAVKVLRWDRNKRMARAVVVEALEPIERGFRVADTPRRFVKVPPRTATLNLESVIVGTIRPLGLYGDNQVVFLNVGAAQGVLPGHRFRVVRQGDAWRQQLMTGEDRAGAQRPVAAPPANGDYPLTVVGEVLALHTRENSTTGLVLSSQVEIEPGDRVRLTDGY